MAVGMLADSYIHAAARGASAMAEWECKRAVFKFIKYVNLLAPYTQQLTAIEFLALINDSCMD
jgi:hypothetical protein